MSEANKTGKQVSFQGVPNMA